MKFSPLLVLMGAMLSISVPASAQFISFVGSTTGNTMPGSPTDYVFVGKVAPFTTGYVPQSTGNPPGPHNLTDFSVSLGTDYVGTYSASASYASIQTPGTTSGAVQTAVVFNSGTGVDKPNLLTFTLGNSSTFDYSSFAVYVMYGNAGASTDATIDLTLRSPGGTSTLVPEFSQAVVDTGAANGKTSAQFAEFLITGAAPGDQLLVGARSLAGTNPLIGGVSFAAVPEPATWAMMAGGFGLLFCVRRFRRAS